MLKKLFTTRNLVVALSLIAAIAIRSSPEVLQKVQRLSAPAERTLSKTNSQPSKPAASTPAKISAGQRIANGHAFPKHKAEFGFTAPLQMAGYIDQVIASSSQANTRKLSRGRVAYWDPKQGGVVIVDPNTRDGGTCFKPRRGRKYFLGLN